MCVVWCVCVGVYVHVCVLTCLVLLFDGQYLLVVSGTQDLNQYLLISTRSLMVKIQAHVHMHVQHIHTYIYIHCIYIHTYIHIYMHAHNVHTNTCTHAHTHTCMHTHTRTNTTYPHEYAHNTIHQHKTSHTHTCTCITSCACMRWGGGGGVTCTHMNVWLHVRPYTPQCYDAGCRHQTPLVSSSARPLLDQSYHQNRCAARGTSPNGAGRRDGGRSPLIIHARAPKYGHFDHLQT